MRKRILVLMTVMALMVAMLAMTVAPAFADCGVGDCSVGAAGTRGEQSEGKAQGFHKEGPDFTNVGNNDAGRIELTGNSVGTLTGTFRHDGARGHGTGVFGDWAGQL